MRAVDRGEVTSRRGAAVLVPDYTKTFDPNRNSTSGMRGYKADTVTTRAFYSDRNTTSKGYSTRAFSGSKVASIADAKFATKEGNTRGKYEIPNMAKAADTKTLAVSDAREANQAATTREVPNAHRPFLGKESEKMNTAVESKQSAAPHERTSRNQNDRRRPRALEQKQVGLGG